MKNTILIIIALAAFLGFLVYAADYGLTLSAINECNKWAKWAEEYNEFYLTETEQAQCDYLGIEIWKTKN